MTIVNKNEDGTIESALVNHGSIEGLHVSFTDGCNVIIGENGAGKSTLLNAIAEHGSVLAHYAMADLPMICVDRLFSMEGMPQWGEVQEKLCRFLLAKSIQLDAKTRDFLIAMENDAVTSYYCLSSGERSVFLLVVNLCSCLEADEGGTVLIDDLDLHLHPKWQSHIIRTIQKEFPNTQFIITTHSPSMVMNMSNESVKLMSREDGKIAITDVIHATIGSDVNRILYHVMDAPIRNPDVQDMHNRIEDLLKKRKKEDVKAAEAIMAQLRDMMDPNDPKFLNISWSIHDAAWDAQQAEGGEQTQKEEQEQDEDDDDYVMYCVDDEGEG